MRRIRKGLCNETKGRYCRITLPCPTSYSTAQRTYHAAFKKLGILGKFNNHDWRSTFDTQLKEHGLSSAIVADLLGHADTRMVETTYARARHEGIMKQRAAVEALNVLL